MYMECKYIYIYYTVHIIYAQVDELERLRDGDAYLANDEFLAHTAVHSIKGRNNVYEG